MLFILLIALGLAMDAFAVAVANGVTLERFRLESALKIALFFGGFQALMPLLGWLAGLGLRELISGFDHWVAFGLLGSIGCKMIYGALRTGPRRAVVPPGLSMLLVLSLATSIDALAVGLSFAFLGVAILAPAVVIGGVTLCLPRPEARPALRAGGRGPRWAHPDRDRPEDPPRAPRLTGLI